MLLLPLLHSVMEISVILLLLKHLITMKVKKGSKVDGPTKDRKEMGMFFLKTPTSMHSTFSPRICQSSCVPILPAKEKNVPMPIVGLNILLKPVRFLARLSSQLQPTLL
jgi:hypothetical protein